MKHIPLAIDHYPLGPSPAPPYNPRLENRRCPIAAENENKSYLAPKKVANARELAIEIARLAGFTHCHNVVILDVSGISNITDYFVLATGTSVRQMRTVCDQCADMGIALKNKPYHTCGYEGERWIAVDFVDVVLHVFDQESRTYYDLDGLWGDAPKVKWNQE